jgi:hypothetical protein
VARTFHDDGRICLASEVVLGHLTLVSRRAFAAPEERLVRGHHQEAIVAVQRASAVINLTNKLPSIIVGYRNLMKKDLLNRELKLAIKLKLFGPK